MKTQEIRRWGRKIPRCRKGKNHNWKNSSDKFGESGICIKCGYDSCDSYYREVLK